MVHENCCLFLPLGADDKEDDDDNVVDDDEDWDKNRERFVGKSTLLFVMASNSTKNFLNSLPAT